MKNISVLSGCCLLQLPIWGFAVTFGIFQEQLGRHAPFDAEKTSIGVIGTTTNGIMYLSMPLLFTLLDRGKWSHLRQRFAYFGVALASTAFFASSFADKVWQLVLLQGILAALGLAILYTTTTLQLDECFVERRATAYGAAFSSKNIVGAATPFLMYTLLDRLGFSWTMRLWALITLTTGLLGIAILPKASPSISRRAQTIPWAFLRHRTFHIYWIGSILQSIGYAIPQTYLTSYAADVLHLPSITSVLLLSLFNLPGIISGITFGFLADKPSIPASINTLISALGSAIFVFAFWAPPLPSLAAVIAFSMGYGFFAGGYSSTWAGWIRHMEREARNNNESLHTGMLYGLLNGVRGVGYAVTGPIGISLLDAGGIGETERAGLGTKYGSLILCTGVCAVLSGWSIAWRGCRKI